MTTRAECEAGVDYSETSKLAMAAFASPHVVFTPERLRWFYERCFALGSTVIALRNGEEKVGQIAIVRQTIMLNGKAESAAQLVDLFISPQFRGRDSLSKLYDEVGRQFEQQDIRFAIGMPNAKALGVNAHFFKLQPFLRLPLYMGVALPWPHSRETVSLPFSAETRGKCAELFSGYATPADENGVSWTAEGLAERLSDLTHRYAVHAVDSVLLISSPRQSRGLSYTLLCGFFARAGARVSRADLRQVVGSACGFWNHPLFAYAGVNERLGTLPGVQLPAKVRPSPLLVQLRDFKPEREPLRFDRFQVLDFDLG